MTARAEDRAGDGAARGAQVDPLAARVARTCALGRPSSSVRLVRREREVLLGRMGVRTVRDVLWHVPYRYVDFGTVSSVLGSQVGLDSTVVVTVDSVTLKHPRPRMSLVEVACYDATAPLMVAFFGQPWLANQFKAGQTVAFFGKVTQARGFKQMTGPMFDVLADAPSPDDDGRSGTQQPRMARMVPMHHTTEGLSRAWVRRICSCAVEDFADICDPWPADVRARRGLMSTARAIRCAQFPDNPEEAEQARRRLAYDEVALLQLALGARRISMLPGVTPTEHVVGGPFERAVAEALPFDLTDEQAEAVAGIRADMASPKPMVRMLLGDVGTGKTAVATAVLGNVADTGSQAAVMAPTGVLADQYARKVGAVLTKAGIAWGLLTGATPQSERESILKALADGTLCVLFGTHALLQDDVVFRRLSLVVIDEQQRFGVAQRHALREKGRGADLLVMTATPIPRTLALALYGDMDLSYLRKRPVPGAGVKTVVIKKRDRAQAYEAISKAVGEGRQAYIVCPLVGTKESVDADGFACDRAADDLACGEDPSDAKAAEQEAEVLQRTVFPAYKVGLLTGRMSPALKNEVMAGFKDGTIQILVSTTVIEVGVDVPNATVMLVEDGERFGLAQLHQLRGRVGRGSHPGVVYIAADTKSPVARERMEALRKTYDGFELAEVDLRLRHEGDIMGSRQAGDTTLRFVDLALDKDLVEYAREDAATLLGGDPRLESPKNLPLRAEMLRVYGDVFKEVGGA